MDRVRKGKKTSGGDRPERALDRLMALQRGRVKRALAHLELVQRNLFAEKYDKLTAVGRAQLARLKREDVHLSDSDFMTKQLAPAIAAAAAQLAADVAIVDVPICVSADLASLVKLIETACFWDLGSLFAHGLRDPTIQALAELDRLAREIAEGEFTEADITNEIFFSEEPEDS